MRSKPPPTAVYIVCAVTALSSNTAFPQDAPVKPGDLVTVVPEQAEVKVGAEVVARVSKGRRLTVKRVQGQWASCLIQDDEQSRTGWIRVRDLRKATSEPSPGLPVTARDPDPADTVLDGEWSARKVEMGNTPFRLEPDNPLVMSFRENQPGRGGSFSCEANGKTITLRDILELPGTGTFRVDASRSPKTFDINAKGGVQIRGILEFREDKSLVVCFGQGRRPKEFSAGVFLGGDGPTMPKLVTLERRGGKSTPRPVSAAPARARPEASGLKPWIMGDWQSIDDPDSTIRFARLDGRRLRTEDGIEFTFDTPFAPDGGLLSKGQRGLWAAAFHFISADTIEYRTLRGEARRMTLANQDGKLVVTEEPGKTMTFRRRSIAPVSGRDPSTDQQGPDGWPSFAGTLAGRNEVRVTNPNEFAVRAGLRSGKRGKDFNIPARSTRSAYVPDGHYDIYFRYSNDEQGIYQGDGFTLAGNGVEIQIVKRTDGNYGIRKVK